MHPLISSAAPVFRRTTRQTLLGAAVLTLIGLAGCATAPAGSAPAATTVNVPSQWSESAIGTKGVVAAEWWRDFGSNELDALIDTALKSNRDLKIAAARLAQARALTDGAQADRRPQLGAVAGAQRGRETGIDPRAERSFAGLRASWEIDVFGRGALPGRSGSPKVRRGAGHVGRCGPLAGRAGAGASRYRAVGWLAADTSSSTGGAARRE